MLYSLSQSLRLVKQLLWASLVEARSTHFLVCSPYSVLGTSDTVKSRGSRTRTHNLPLWRRMHYQLCYTPRAPKGVVLTQYCG